MMPESNLVPSLKDAFAEINAKPPIDQAQANITAPFTVPYVKQTTWLERHVNWLRKKKTALAVFETTLLSISIIGIPWVIKAAGIWRRQNAESHFYNAAKKKLGPSSEEIVDFPTATRAFNHINEYAIEDNTIWYRRRSSRDEWQPIYFDGKNPKRIDTDGANLIVVDDKTSVHYKKLFKEYRVSEIDFKNNRHLKPHENAIKALTTTYVAVDKSALNNWKAAWFSLPVLHHLVNAIEGKRLDVSDETISTVIAHRGRFNDYIEDAAGQKHHVSAGVTTLYMLASDGRSIRKYDPWSPKHTDVRLYFPETDTTCFVALKIATSASTIMAIGYEIDIQTGKKTLKVLSKLGDIDTEGWNPSLKYSYRKNDKDRKVRVLPIGIDKAGNEWTEHTLPTGANITDLFFVKQTGKGNDARLMQIHGKNKDGVWGNFSKNMTDPNWQFMPGTNRKNHGKLLAREVRDAHTYECVTTVHNYLGKTKDYTIKLENFGDHSYRSRVVLTHQGKTYTLPLYKKHGLASFLGKVSFTYDLVIPQQYENDKFISGLFSKKDIVNGMANISVKVNQKKATVAINAKRFCWNTTLPVAETIRLMR